MATMFPYIVTDDQLNITIKGVPHSYGDGEPEYKQLVDLIIAPDNRDDDIIVIGDRIKGVAQYLTSTSKLQVRGNDLYIGDEVVTGKLSRRILDMMHKGFDVTPLSLFVENLYQNPSAGVVNKLWEFMEYGKLPVTPDGHFLAYKRLKYGTIDGKRVLVDCHSGKICNEVGSIVEMPRRKVDDDCERTCSYGLHACSHEYLASFPGNATVTVKINPADVVAIPPDYNNTKLRCCRYEVIELLPDNAAKKLLSEKPVMTRYTPAEDEEYDNEDNEEAYEDRRQASVAPANNSATANSPRWVVHIGTISATAPYTGQAGRYATWSRDVEFNGSSIYKVQQEVFDARASARYALTYNGLVASNIRARKYGTAPVGKQVIGRIYDNENQKYL